MRKLIGELTVRVMIAGLTLFLAGCVNTELPGIDSNADAQEVILYVPPDGEYVYLLDEAGNNVHEWRLSGGLARSAYLLEGGRLLVLEASRRIVAYSLQPDIWGNNSFEPSSVFIEILDWSGNREWSFEALDKVHYLHGGIETLPNGNILAIVYERITSTDATVLGFDSIGSEVWSEAIYEIDPGLGSGNDAVVWKWYATDHLLPAGMDALANPQLIDPSYRSSEETAFPDWLHANAIDYNAATDQILLSLRNTSEFWVINHGINSEKAAGSTGDLVYRFGNPAAYGGTSYPILDGQYDVQWIDGNDGGSNILLFNSNRLSLKNSTVMELNVDLNEFGSGTVAWEYGDHSGDDTFKSIGPAGVQRLANGNTLMWLGENTAYGGPRVFEVASDGHVAMDINLSTYGGGVSSVRKYHLDFPLPGQNNVVKYILPGYNASF